MNIARLIAQGRLDPVLEPRDGYELLVGWRRPAGSRKVGNWNLRVGTPWQAPMAVLRRTRGAVLVADERARQIGFEGFDGARDDGYTAGELLMAGRCYSLWAARQAGDLQGEGTDDEFLAYLLKQWPWDRNWWKPSTDIVRNRVKAGALYWAEADRLKRAGVTGPIHRLVLNAVDAEAAFVDVILVKRGEAIDVPTRGNPALQFRDLVDKLENPETIEVRVKPAVIEGGAQ